MEMLAAWILLTASSLVQSAQVPQQISVTVAEVGGDFTLNCPMPEGALLLYWLKFNFGYMIQKITIGDKGNVQPDGQFKNAKIKFRKVDGMHSLTIHNVSKDDEATYFCQAGEAFKMQFTNGSILTVNDHTNVQKQVFVKRSPESESVREGDSVTLQCSLLFKSKENKVQCPDEHSVNWFRNGSSETDPGILYTHSSRRTSDEDKKSCIYRLSKTIHKPSDTGAYYCAVVTCGQILFGGGTQLETTVGQTAQVPQQITVTVADVGDDLNLTCSVPKGAWLFDWHKLNFGYMVQTIAASNGKSKGLDEQFKNPRIKILKVDDELILTIKNVSKDDEATYFCQAGMLFRMQFINGFILAVNDHKNVQQRQVYVKQSPESESVREGDSVTLQCSLLFKNKENKENKVQCPDEHSVHWFRNGSTETDPGILYAHSSRVRTSEEDNKSCSYSLSKTIHKPSDTGTYYCAVVTCGQILFGEGTKVETIDSPGQELLCLAVMLGTLMLCWIIMLTALIYSGKQADLQRRDTTSAHLYSSVSEKLGSHHNDEDAGVYSVAVFTAVRSDTVDELMGVKPTKRQRI